MQQYWGKIHKVQTGSSALLQQTQPSHSQTPSLPTHRHGDGSHNSLNLAPWPQQAGRNKLLRNTRLNIITAAQTTQGKIIMVCALCGTKQSRKHRRCVVVLQTVLLWGEERGYRHHNPPRIWARINYHAQHSRLFLRAEAIFGWGREVSLLQGLLAMSSALPIHEEDKKNLLTVLWFPVEIGKPISLLSNQPWGLFYTA